MQEIVCIKQKFIFRPFSECKLSNFFSHKCSLGFLRGGLLTGSYELVRVQLCKEENKQARWQWLLGPDPYYGELRLTYKRTPSADVAEDEQTDWEEQVAEANFEDDETDGEEEKNNNENPKLIEENNGERSKTKIRKTNEEKGEFMAAEKNQEVKHGKEATTTTEDDLGVVILLQLHLDEKDNKELAKLKFILKHVREDGQVSLSGLQLSLSQLLPSCGNYFRCYGSHVGSTWMVYARPLPLNANQLSLLLLQ
jgi:hypothetical protein